MGSYGKSANPNLTWVNWGKVQSQIDAAKGVQHPKGPHRMSPGLTYTIAGTIADPRPTTLRDGRPMVRFTLRRKEMAIEALPLECVAFGRAAERLADFVRENGIENPVCLIGQYQLRGEDYSFRVMQSRLPTLGLALSNAVRFPQGFRHCS
ncbi:hypothetical protein WV31_19190 [Magnetospirillum sp. ME-1]|uniref:hypothetical protein n=1 Tax=Magnetospirillum sp. ME-1 TaxID=1639348 RepID=UPI000A17A3C5|nr:hypothetical protein [Magnetospirillum sp. ME-1]ARJ67627.1 hypothetical protein WV31_19190 [Magnetospirillum sp. ME-1]